jgi:iron complex outermembrane receptor protein
MAPVRAASPADASLEEVMVTARKWEERLIDVPMSVTALQGEILDFTGTVNTEDLIGVIPSLSMSSDLLSPGKDFNYFAIRGVGANTGGDPAVPVFVDGVYQPRLGLDMDFIDVERVEVLRGPQSTLFGRNALGGAVNIVSRRPGKELRAKTIFEVDDFPSYRGFLAVGGPLSDTVSASASIDGAFTEGYLVNTGTGRTNQGEIDTGPPESADSGQDLRARGSMRFLPNDELEIFVTGDYSKFTGLWGLPGVPRGCECYETHNEFQIDAEDESYGGALIFDWNMDSVVLSGITGYRSLSTLLPFDFDGGTDRTPNYHDFRTAQEYFSQEVRVASDKPDARLRWLAGLYYFNEKLDSQRRYSLLDQDVFPSGLKIDAQDTYIDRTGWAGFGQIDFSITDAWILTAGARYSSEDVDGSIDLDFTLYDFLGPGVDFPFQAAETESASFSDTTWTASLSYAVASDARLYATAATGFKAGGFPLSAADLASFTPYDNETSINYELGYKGRLLDGRLYLETAAFLIDLEDQQLAAVIEVTLPGTDTPVPVATTANAGQSSIYGGELTTTFQPTEAWLLGASVGYTHTEFDDYVDASGVQHEGEAFRFVPEWTANFTAEYTFPIVEGKYDVSLYASYRYVDDYTQGYGVFIDPEFNVEAYDLIDVIATLIHDRWRLQLFVDNLTDEYIETRVWNTFFILPDGSRTFSTVLPPRRIGLRFTYEL